MIGAGFARTREAALPNLLVSIDLRDGEPTGPSLFALSECRRIAHLAGATVYAIVMNDRELDQAVTARLGRAGADKVLLCEGPGLEAPPLEATHGPALLAAVERVAPLLVLFPAGGAGAALGPSLAARIGAAFAGLADLEASDAEGPLPDGVGRAFLRRWDRDRAAYRRLDPVEIERAVVAILPAGEPRAEPGSDDVDVQVIACAAPADPGLAEIDRAPDPAAALALARVLVVLDAAVGEATVAALAAQAPPGVAVVDRAGAVATLLAGAPRILIAVGGAGPAAATPHGRTGAILPAGAAAPPGSVDVVWEVAAGTSPAELARAVAAALTALAPGTAP